MTSSLKVRGASSSSSSAHRWRYDVYLSFRGADTRRTFTAHLYDALERNGLNTFIDDELGYGEQISLALFKAVEESRISIVVFSRNYAASGWCLDELTKIVECMEKKQQKVVPVFYDVDQSDVRHQQNEFRRWFAKHEERFNPEKVQRWRDVLKRVGDLSGFHVFRNRNEVELIRQIVQFVKNYKNLQVAKHPIEIESPVQESNLSSSPSLDGIESLGIESSVQEPHLSSSPSSVEVEYLVQEPDSPPSQVGIESSVQESDLSISSIPARTEPHGILEYRVQEPDSFPSQVVIEAAVLLLQLSSLPSGNGNPGNVPSVSSKQQSNSSIPSEGVFLFLIGSVIALHQLGDAFKNHPLCMWLSQVALIIVCLTYVTIPKADWKSWKKLIRLISGAFFVASLSSIRLPHHLWWLFFVIWAGLVFVLIVAVIWIYWAKINAALRLIYSRARGRGSVTRNRRLPV